MKGKVRAAISVSSLIATSVYASPSGIYWSDIGTGTIEFVQFEGSGHATLLSGLANPQGLDVTDNYLYWTDRDDLRIRRGNPDGTNAQIILNTSPGVPRDLFVTEEYIYWTNSGVDSISRVDIDGTNPVDLVTTGLSFPNGIYLTDNYIYWSDSGTTSIKEVATTEPTQLK